MKRILVPLDGSRVSEGALPHVHSLAHSNGAEVFLLRVVTGPADLHPTPTGQMHQGHEASEEHCRAYLNAFTATLTHDAGQRTLQVGNAHTWFEVRLGSEPFDVINNVGSNLYRGGFGGDRGFLERDLGQFEEPAEVFAWCGGAVLLKRSYLDDVGVFDEHLFLYYEDTDLSWRGRLQGWRYLYEPSSLVRHRHAASSGVGSPVFLYYTERNRLLVLAKNAPAKLALRAGLGEVRRFARNMVSAYVMRPLRLQMPERSHSAHRRRVLKSYLRLLPAMVRARRAAHPKVDRASLMSWEMTK